MITQKFDISKKPVMVR